MILVFVCFGNTCRSVLAKYLFIDAIKKRKFNIKVESMGVDANKGSNRASENTIAVLREIGIDAKKHKVKQMDKIGIRMADLVLVMEKEQMNFIDDEMLNRTFLISNFAYSLKKWSVNTGDIEIEFSDFEEDVEDPYGRDITVYRTCRDKIKEYIDIIVSKMCFEENISSQ
ncbi:MAG: arsenate reductase/protein-tyrosine-phosphatase family protein [bacterium]